MPSSSTSSSSVEIINISSPRSAAADTEGRDTAAALTGPVAERYASSLRTQDAVYALCKKHGIPKGFTARHAGDRRACAPPPPGAVCVYAHALEAGMRVPLHAFFCDVLGHYGLAPGQLAPIGWRVLAGFVVLCHDAGVRPVFRHFFSLCMFKVKGWYYFRGKDAAGVLFTGPSPHKSTGWKERFFFLSSPARWPCPVRWGEPPAKNISVDPVLTAEEKKSAAKLLGARGAAVDLRTYLCKANLDAAFSDLYGRASAPSPRTPGAKGMDPSIYDMMQSMRADKAGSGVQMPAPEKVKTEPDRDAAARSRLSGNKRKQDEGDAKEGASRAGACPPPGFSAQKPPPQRDEDGNPQHIPDSHDGDAASWEAARVLLQGVVTPSREGMFAEAKPSDIVAATYLAMLQAANYASFSFGYGLELEKKLTAAERDAAADARALREEVGKVKAELAGAKAAAESELKGAKAAAVQEFIGSGEHKRRLAEHALEGYERGMEDMKRVVLRRYPQLDAARLVVPPRGPV